MNFFFEKRCNASEIDKPLIAVFGNKYGLCHAEFLFRA